ncbi:unnamed protein product [Caenorhabditis auriculariae]|uniref:BHLH domain-containing protein n=1 Tax=Caenorhabditis auriculariae TaxID=2777116 RepID=A0A8S1HDG8_9PELO|nr:unnamed protein product [Caenorhabditis auriculariae]
MNVNGKRVHQVNHGFDILRTRLRPHAANKKLSKADTLREAVKYIAHLQSLLGAEQYNASVFPTTCSTSNQMFFPNMPPADDFDMYFPQGAPAPNTSQQQSPAQGGYLPYTANVSPTTSTSCGSYSPPQQPYMMYHSQGMRHSP